MACAAVSTRDMLNTVPGVHRELVECPCPRSPTEQKAEPHGPEGPFLGSSPAPRQPVPTVGPCGRPTAQTSRQVYSLTAVV